MDLQTTIEFIRDHRKDLTLFNLTGDRAIVDELASYFRTQNLRIRSVRTASGRPREIAVLGSRGEVLERVEVSLLRELVDSDPTASDKTYRSPAGSTRLSGQ